MTKKKLEKGVDYEQNGEYLTGPETTRFSKLSNRGMDPLTPEGSRKIRDNMQEEKKKFVKNWMFKTKGSMPFKSVKDIDLNDHLKNSSIEIEGYGGKWKVFQIETMIDYVYKKVDVIFTVEKETK